MKGGRQQRGTFIGLKMQIRGLQYQDNEESILQIQKKGYGLNYLVQHVLFPPLVDSFIARNLEL